MAGAESADERPDARRRTRARDRATPLHRLLSALPVRLPWRRSRVAVLEFHGSIGGAIRLREYLPAIKALRQNRRVAAVVLDIDSPGGSASVSDALYVELRKLATRKPIVSYIRSVGASGGYYVAVAGSPVVAGRASIVGSIGVITIRPVAESALSRIGVRVEVARTGPLKGMGLPFVEPTEAERAKDQRMVNQFFDLFVRVVAEGRHLPQERVRGWATGEVFWGPEALELGLVDELGDLDRATALAAKLARIPEKVVRVKPRRAPIWQRLTGQAAEAFVRAVSVEIERALATRVEYRWTGRPGPRP